MSDVVEYVFEHYPHIARRVGRHGFDGCLPALDGRSATDLDHLRAAATSRLGSLPEQADPEVRADLGAALGILADERFRIAGLGRAHFGPLEVLAETNVSVYLRSPRRPLAERLLAVEGHLVRIPDFLEHSARTLPARLPAGERLRGVEQARAQAVNLRDIAGRLALDHPELAGEGLAAAASAAAEACEDFARAVAKTAPAKALFGPEVLAEFLQAAEGIEHPVDDLLAEASAEVDAIASALDSAAAKLGVGQRQQAYALMADQVSDGSVLESLNSIMQRMKDFWVRQDIVSVETVNPLEVRRAPQLAGAARVEFSISAPLDEVRQPHILYVPEPPESAAHGASLRREYLNDPMLEVIAVHEAFVGHYVQVEASSRGPSMIRTCIPWFPGFTEGWAHYAEELAIERGLAEGRPLVEVAQLKSALEAATRLLVFLSVHMARWTLAEAAERAAALCNWSPERAAREVLIVAADATGAMYTLGKLRIREWRKRIEVGTSRWELRNFHDRLLHCGSAPLSAAWQYYLDGQHDPRSASVSSNTRFTS
ncbi:DUF885 family protein [Saccharopolyspora shandongensis]|uniref:DUF885 family protein n=1 Tax=Saccharopolyspora shandongensis TaxID=418495 RepID=UPI0033E5A1F9